MHHKVNFEIDNTAHVRNSIKVADFFSGQFWDSPRTLKILGKSGGYFCNKYSEVRYMINGPRSLTTCFHSYIILFRLGQLRPVGTCIA